MSWFERKLELKKTHDYCAAQSPKLTVVMIHGIAADSSSYSHALTYLEGTTSLKEVRFVTFDLLGAGKSRKSDKLNYGFEEQLEALHNSILKLNIDTPMVLVGHSMGTMIAARYASLHKRLVQKLILISAPVYTEKDLESTAFAAAIKVFKEAVSVKNRKVLETKCFNNEMNRIVLNKHNYRTFAELTVPTVLIYGNLDQFVAPFNYPKLLKDNKEYLTAIKTEGRHGVSRDKYTKMVGILEETLNA